MVVANSICLGVRLPSAFSESSREDQQAVRRRAQLVRHIASSDLYFDVSASCSPFSSIDRRASSIWTFLRSTSMFGAKAARLSCSSSSLVC